MAEEISIRTECLRMAISSGASDPLSTAMAFERYILGETV